MEQTSRWFIPDHSITLSDIAQSRATGAATAFHHITNNQVREIDTIQKRINTVNYPANQSTCLEWTVVENILVHDDIKNESRDFLKHIRNCKQSDKNLTGCKNVEEKAILKLIEKNSNLAMRPNYGHKMLDNFNKNKILVIQE